MENENQTAAQFRYKAFISYSHRDKAWGDWLHKALESYRVPKRLVGTSGREGELPSRLFPIFRDREELPTSDDLPSQILSALEASQYLIVICSPNAAQSRWVTEEILAFKRLGRESQIFAIIVDGEPNASDKQRSGDTPVPECFPEALRFHFGAEGKLSTTRTEPIAADAREHGDGKENAKLKLIAGMLGVGFDALKQRDVEAQRARFRKFAIATASVIVALLSLLTLSVIFLVTSEKTRNHALVAQSEFLAQRSQEATASGNAELGLLLALEALPHQIATPDRPLTIDALGALTQAYLSLRERVFRVERGSIAWSRLSLDGKRVAFGHSPNALRVYAADAEMLPAQVRDVATGRLLALLPDVGNLGEEVIDGAERLAFSPDGTTIASVSDKAVRLTVASSGQTLALLPGDAFRWVAFSPNGARIITDSRFSIAIWDARSLEKLIDLRHDDVETTSGRGVLAISPDSNTLVVAFGAKVHIWSMKTGRLIAVFAEPEEGIGSISFSPDSKRMVTSQAQFFVGPGEASVWDATTGRRLAQLKEPREGSLVVRAGFTDGGNTITTSSYQPNGKDHIVRVWDAVGYREIRTDFALPEGQVSLTVSRNGTYARITDDGLLRVWDNKGARSLDLGAGEFGAIAIANGEKFAAASSNGAVWIWAMASGQLQAVLKQADAMRYARFSRDGTKLLMGSSHEDAVVWDIAAGHRPVRVWHRSQSPSAALSPDGTRVASADRDKVVRIWNVANGKLLMALRGHSGPVESVVFSTDGQRLLTATRDGIARIWDSETGRLQVVFSKPRRSLRVALFVPDGSEILTAHNDEVARVWDAVTGQLRLELRAVSEDASFVDTISVSPDGSKVALLAGSIGEAGGVAIASLFDLKSGRLLASLRTREGDVNSVSFSPDGTEVVTALRDNTVRIWSATTGRQLQVLPSNGSLKSAEFSADGGRLVAGGERGVHVWNLPRCQTLVDRSIERTVVLHLSLSELDRRRFFLDRQTKDIWSRITDFFRPLFVWASPAISTGCA